MMELKDMQRQLNMLCMMQKWEAELPHNISHFQFSAFKAEDGQWGVEDETESLLYEPDMTLVEAEYLAMYHNIHTDKGDDFETAWALVDPQP